MVPWQGVVLPAIVPGCAGNGETATASVRAMPVPQALLAVTVIVPPVAPTVATMVFVVELPDQPAGKNQE